MTDDERRLQLTRLRDLLLIGGITLIVGYALVRWNYGSLPVLPRLAGLSAAVLGIGETLAGFNIRARLRVGSRSDQIRTGSSPDRGGNGRWRELKPLPPLVGARAVMVAKASSLAGAGLTGLWVGLLAYVVPLSGSVRAASADSATGLIGLVSAVVMTVGALWLERCCVHPDDSAGRGGGS
jgi:hypothetical protein